MFKLARRSLVAVVFAVVTGAVAIPTTTAAAAAPTGYLVSFGDNYYGELGQGNVGGSVDTPTGVPRVAGLAGVSAGSDFSLALTSSGKVLSWGHELNGVLGNGLSAEASRAVPALVSGLPSIKEISAGYVHSLALTRAGRVWGWGAGSSGELGPGVKSVAARPVAIAGLSGIVQVAAGGDFFSPEAEFLDGGFSLALRRDGTVWAWGANAYGELGEPNSLFSANIPYKVPELRHVVDIAAGSGHALALERNGSVWSWGDDTYGQLGDSAYCGPYDCWRSTPLRISGLPAMKSVAAGGNDSAAIERDGRLWTWGDNYDGQLGMGMSCSSGPAGQGFGCASSTPRMVRGLSEVASVAVGKNGVFGGHMLALMSGHSLYAWGDNQAGELGNQFVTPTSATPIQVQGNLEGESVSIAAGDSFSLVVRSPSL